MIMVYINYPNPRISIHNNQHCHQIFKNHRKEPRIVTISEANYKTILAQFKRGEHKFGAYPAVNDMYLSIDMGNKELEENALTEIIMEISRYYSPIGRAVPSVHC